LWQTLQIILALFGIYSSAIAQLQSLPLQDPQRLNQNKDAITQAAINFENAMIKTAAQMELAGDKSGHNQIILMNNMAVCWDAAHNHDNITTATCVIS
jgi:hypothetical protein